MNTVRIPKGFSLPELMVVLAIIGILSSIAYPVYHQHMLETRRTDAWVALHGAAAAQQRLYAVHFKYTDDMNQLGGADSAEGFYTLSVVADAASYTLTAKAKSTKIQAGDLGCTVLTLTETGIESPSDCW